MRARALLTVAVAVALLLCAPGPLCWARLPEAPTPRERVCLLRMMTQGSGRMSRTTQREGAAAFAGHQEVRFTPRSSERRFRAAAKHVLANYRSLPLTLETATALNRLLTEGEVPERLRGQASYRADPAPFFRWLASPQGRELERRDPVELAGCILWNLSSLDAFPDGNGRTARLMADLALLRHGLAPASYRPRHLSLEAAAADYFRQASPFDTFGGTFIPNPKRLTGALDYFRRAAQRGQEEWPSYGYAGDGTPSRGFQLFSLQD